MGQLNAFLSSNDVTVLGICVLLIFGGAGLAAKMDTKWGYVIAAGGLVVALYTLRLMGIL